MQLENQILIIEHVFASKLWCVFKSIITGPLSAMLFLIGKERENVLASIENSVTQFLKKQ